MQAVREELRGHPGVGEERTQEVLLPHLSCEGRDRGEPTGRAAHKEEPRENERSGQESSQERGEQLSVEGFTDKNGYVYVMVDRLQSPTREIAAQMTKTRYILEHRAVKAADVGRPLLRTEQVHHVNGVKNDNRLENLSILDSRKHSLKHRTLERKYSAALKRIEELEMKLEGLRSAPT
jgi:hypothetical protein